jgi:hypothetical protein
MIETLWQDVRHASHAKRTIHLFDGRVVEESLAAS